MSGEIMKLLFSFGCLLFFFLGAPLLVFLVFSFFSPLIAVLFWPFFLLGAIYVITKGFN